MDEGDSYRRERGRTFQLPINGASSTGRCNTTAIPWHRKGLVVVGFFIAHALPNELQAHTK
jgi:hypothetical protein